MNIESLANLLMLIAAMGGAAIFGWQYNSIVIKAGVRNRVGFWYYIADWAMANGDAATLRNRNRELYSKKSKMQMGGEYVE